MNQIERQVTKGNPLTTALVTGLGWGLVFGFVDGLDILLELPILLHLRVRLQSLAYLVIWCGLAGAIVIGLVGLITWGILGFLRWEVRRYRLVAIYSGLSVGLVGLIGGPQTLGVSLGHLADPDYAVTTLVLVVLASVMGLIVGLSTYAGARWWQGGRGLLRPLRWRVVRVGVIAVFLIGVVALSVVGVYRAYLRDSAVFRPRPSGQVATPEQPNIVLITVDALRADHLGIYGYDPEISPNIDGLAERGVVFDQAISQSSWTAPSVASFTTSLHPTALGISHRLVSAIDMHVDLMRITLAEALDDAGYRTQAYITNGFIAPHHLFDQGFDGFVYARSKYLFDQEELQRQSLVKLVCQGTVGARYTHRVCNLFHKGYELLFDPWLAGSKGYLVTKNGMRFMQLHKDERFFLWLYYMEPHTYYDPPKLFRPLPSEITPVREQYLRHTASWQLNKALLRPVDLQALASLYDSDIAYVDTLVGQVLAEMDRLGLADRTVVVFNSDHGEEFFDHGGMEHGHTLYDEVLRVPFIISGPGIEIPGQRVETQVRLLDLMPTLCEFAGASPPQEAEGRSLVPILEGEQLDELPAFSEALGSQAPFEKKSIRYDGYKLIHNVGNGEVELYNLRVDPHEQVNLAEREPEIVERMMTELEIRISRSVQMATELPRLRPLSLEMDDEMRRRLREAGY